MRPWFVGGVVAVSVLVMGVWSHAQSDRLFRLGRDKYRGGESVEIVFTSPQKSTPTDRKWINITFAKNADTDWGVWKFVDNNAKSMVLVAPMTPGKYEVRLFDNYPKQTAHLIERQPVTIE
jgi:hypothetical protein